MKEPSKVVCKSCGEETVTDFKDALDGCPVCLSQSIEIYGVNND